MKNNEIYFVRRIKDKKYLRGAKFWKWCKSWRNAAIMPKYSWWELYILKTVDTGKRNNICPETKYWYNSDEVELVTLHDIYCESRVNNVGFTI